jgi:oxidase EvaA
MQQDKKKRVTLSYSETLDRLQATLADDPALGPGSLFVESMVEKMKDWSELYTYDQVKSWFLRQRENADMDVEYCKLENLSGWHIDEESGWLFHESGRFFSVRGIKVRSPVRESEGDWDQPIVVEWRSDGGIVGLLRARRNTIPYYLVEAKQEPGNPGLVQISPTLQASYSNLGRAHGGRSPYFHEFFAGTADSLAEVLVDQYVSEDGGRLYNKRNRCMLVETRINPCEIEVPDNFIWLSLWQIKALLNKPAWVNCHIRSVLSFL